MRRRGFLGFTAGLAAALAPWPLQAAEAAPMVVPAGAANGEWGDTPVTLTQGTNLAVALSPDGRTLALDLQGLLWTLPVAGGQATRLSDYLHDLARPQWSPDGQRLVFQSYRDGSFQLWTLAPDGSGLTQHTRGEFDCREPHWSPDGKELVFASDRSGRYALYVLTLASGAVRLLVDTEGQDGEPMWSPDGQRVAFSSSGRICVVDVAAPGDVRVVAAGPGASAPAWSPQGRLSWRQVAGTPRDLQSSRLMVDGVAVSDADEDVFPVPAIWLQDGELLYTADGQIRRRRLGPGGGVVGHIPFQAAVRVTAQRPPLRRRRDFDSMRPRRVKGIAFPALSPDARQLAFGALGQLWLLQVGDPQPRALTHDSSAKLGPAWSPDGRQLVYACDRSGSLQLWLHELASGQARQLTHADLPLKQAAWSPDGQRIVCASEDGWLLLVDPHSGALQRLAKQTVWSGRPSWSPDGQHLALAAVQPYSARYREGLTAILTVHLASGRMRYQLVQPGVSLDVRNVNGPLWTPDGRHFIYTLGGSLWRSPIAADGTLQGPPEPLGEDSADALSLSADGSRLLYLSNARLRLRRLDAASAASAAQELPLQLHWQQARPAGTTVVHAGRFWDGLSDTLRENVDIVIRGHRIAAIEAHRPQRRGVRWVDASTQTVMPGLIDMHTHREMGNQLGAREPRIFLAYGITSTRGLSDNAYLTLENKESVDAGLRIGPRHFGTGEALDGARVFYDGMHPIRDSAQLLREFERAQALDYDLLKCYVRLPPELQARATDMAWRLGIPITSHYLFPAVAFGAQGHEHMGGTSRYGYSRTGSMLGTGYQDVVAIAAASKSFRTPTIFGLEALLGDTPQDVLQDPRVQRLFPPAERAALERAARGGPSRPLRMVARQVATLRAQQAAGVTIVCGSDYPIVAPGISLHLNLRAMAQHGMRPVDALRTATANAGRVLGHDLGTLVRGQLADLVCVDGNPLQDIQAAQRVRRVMVGGVDHTVDDLVAAFAPQPSLAAVPSPHAAAVPAQPGDEAWWHDPHWVAEVRSSCCTPTA